MSDVRAFTRRNVFEPRKYLAFAPVVPTVIEPPETGSISAEEAVES